MQLWFYTQDAELVLHKRVTEHVKRTTAAKCVETCALNCLCVLALWQILVVASIYQHQKCSTCICCECMHCDHHSFVINELCQHGLQLDGLDH